MYIKHYVVTICIMFKKDKQKHICYLWKWKKRERRGTYQNVSGGISE